MKSLSQLFGFSRHENSVGICLSGGGALGFAHIGVLQSLEDHGIRPTHISGSSMGAIVGALYAAGYTPEQMLQMIKNDKLYKVTRLMTFRPGFLNQGLSSHSVLRSLIREMIPHNSFGQLEKKLQVCVANLNTAEWEMVDSGNNLDLWVAASASIPGVFEAIYHANNYYVDGGLLNNFPAQGLEKHCRSIIGVDVIPLTSPRELKRTIDTLALSVRAMQYQNSKAGRSLCHHVIEPRAIDEYHEFNFDAYQAIYQQGYSAATRYIAQNPGIMKLADGDKKDGNS